MDWDQHCAFIARTNLKVDCVLIYSKIISIQFPDHFPLFIFAHGRNNGKRMKNARVSLMEKNNGTQDKKGLGNWHFFVQEKNLDTRNYAVHPN